MTECPCLTEGPKSPHVIDEHYLGCDETEGRFADVTTHRCSRCSRLWLRYQVEYEAFTASGRWAETPIDENTLHAMTPERVAAFLDNADFYIFGGSFWGHAGRRGRGRLGWSIAGAY